MSAKRVEYHQGAIADIKSAVSWYEKHSRKAALDFIEELNRASETIHQSPKPLAWRKEQYKTILAWRFPFVVIYSEEESKIIIWAVAHGSRRPEYWSHRL